MRDKIKDAILYGYYGGMLNGHQREIMRLYYDCDMSLSEISVELGITRQGVREIIVRSVAKLSGLESKLGLVARIKGIEDKLVSIMNADGLSAEMKTGLGELLTEIEEI
jgi:predicted DNA-binding protein YlxM (UPF0122 family)